jgi:hypothetical protein
MALWKHIGQIAIFVTAATGVAHEVHAMTPPGAARAVVPPRPRARDVGEHVAPPDAAAQNRSRAALAGRLVESFRAGGREAGRTKLTVPLSIVPTLSGMGFRVDQENDTHAVVSVDNRQLPGLVESLHVPVPSVAASQTVHAAAARVLGDKIRLVDTHHAKGRTYYQFESVQPTSALRKAANVVAAFQRGPNATGGRPLATFWVIHDREGNITSMGQVGLNRNGRLDAAKPLGPQLDPRKNGN